MIYKGLLKNKLRKSKIRLNKQKEKVRVREEENRTLKHELRVTRQELSEIKENLTTQFCPGCEEWFMVVWDQERGLTAYCPYCGERVMLCSRCSRSDETCDYDYLNDLCSEM